MNVVSVSFFGPPEKTERYWPYFPLVIRSHHNLYPTWKYRIYHDHYARSGPYAKVLRALNERGLVEMVCVAEEGERVLIEKAMLWRLLPLWDERVERFVIRDVDMLSTYRERCAVETWIRSGLTVHSLADKRGDHDWPAINGMMGFHVKETRKLLALDGVSFDEFLDRAGWSEDVWGSNFRASGNEGANARFRVSSQTTNNQFFLGTHIWPAVVRYACEHRLSGSMLHNAALTCTEVERYSAKELQISEEMLTGSDEVTPFIGASHLHDPPLDVDKATSFYKKYGNREIERIISECESA